MEDKNKDKAMEEIYAINDIYLCVPALELIKMLSFEMLKCIADRNIPLAERIVVVQGEIATRAL